MDSFSVPPLADVSNTSPDPVVGPRSSQRSVLADEPETVGGRSGARRELLDSLAKERERSRALEGSLRRVADLFPTTEVRAVRLIEGALAQFGAHGAVACQLVDGDATLEVVGATDPDTSIFSPGTRHALDSDLPLAEAARTGRVVQCGTREALLRRYPALAEQIERMGWQAIAAAPARHMGRVHGSLALAWTEPRRLEPAEQLALRALGGRLARALANARLYYAERAAHAAADQARRAEAEARAEADRQRRAAEDANRAKDDFLAVVSHELRTPLQAILGFSELLATEIAGPLAPRQQDYVHRVQAAGGHLLDTIENLLGFARAQAGKEVVSAAPFDAAATVAQVLDIAAPLAGRRGIALTQEGPRAGIVATSDEKKVRQIVTNLVANAVKFTEHGRVTAEVTIVGDPGVGERLRVAVRDTGIGIPAEQLARVFEPFVQVAGGPGTAGTTRGTAGGTGLGLSIVRQLAQLLGGEVTATSEAGKGSEFVVEVPRGYRG